MQIPMHGKKYCFRIKTVENYPLIRFNFFICGEIAANHVPMTHPPPSPQTHWFDISCLEEAAEGSNHFQKTWGRPPPAAPRIPAKHTLIFTDSVRIHEILVRIHLWLMNPDPDSDSDPAIFISNLQDVNKKLFLAYYFFGFLNIFSITFCSVADPGCLSRILIFTHSGFRISDPKTATKERGEKKFSCRTFFCSHKIHKIENYFIFYMLKKKIWASF